MSLDCSSSISAVLPTFVPSLSDLAAAFSSSLPSSFASVSVDVVPCPDLSAAPFNLSSPGFGKNLRIAEVGGPGNLFPTINKEKAFDIKKIAESTGLKEAFAFGPGAGPWPIVGVNCEMVADVNTKEGKVGTRTAKLDASSPGGYKVESISSPTFSLMANLAVSEPSEGGDVVHIRVSHRTGAVNFPNSLRNALVSAFPGKLVSLGGIFILHKGAAKLHIMPDFPACGCFESEEKIGSEWLQFFTMKAPLVCATVMHSNDGGHKLRVEHTHCYSDQGDGGHYHYDVTPEEVEYEAWFSPAHSVYRIDEV